MVLNSNYCENKLEITTLRCEKILNYFTMGLRLTELTVERNEVFYLNRKNISTEEVDKYVNASIEEKREILRNFFDSEDEETYREEAREYELQKKYLKDIQKHFKKIESTIRVMEISVYVTWSLKKCMDDLAETIEWKQKTEKEKEKEVKNRVIRSIEQRIDELEKMKNKYIDEINNPVW